MERIVAQVARGEKNEVPETREAAEFRAGVTKEIQAAGEIAKKKGSALHRRKPKRIPRTRLVALINNYSIFC